jgi:hypothetical protein
MILKVFHRESFVVLRSSFPVLRSSGVAVRCRITQNFSSAVGIIRLCIENLYRKDKKTNSEFYGFKPG